MYIYIYIYIYIYNRLHSVCIHHLGGTRVMSVTNRNKQHNNWDGTWPYIITHTNAHLEQIF